MVLTDTAPTTRRLVNAAAYRIRLDDDGTPYRIDLSRGGCWGRPEDAIAHAVFCRRIMDADAVVAVHIVDVQTHEHWWVPVTGE